MTESSSRFDDDVSSIDPPGVNPELEASEFEQCYLVYAAGVRAALRMRLSNELDVEDCLNRVFEKLWSRGRSIPPAARRAWLFVVARNEAALWGRNASRHAGAAPRRQSRQRHETPGHVRYRQGTDGDGSSLSSSDGCRSHDPAPLERLLRQEEIESLRRASSCLSSEQAEVLRYRFFEDLPFREVAQRLGIPLGTALSRARSAIKRLRDELNQLEESD